MLHPLDSHILENIRKILDQELARYQNQSEERALDPKKQLAVVNLAKVFFAMRADERETLNKGSDLSQTTTEELEQFVKEAYPEFEEPKAKRTSRVHNTKIDNIPEFSPRIVP